MEIRSVPYDCPDAQFLDGFAQAEYISLYGSGDDSPMDPAEFVDPQGGFFVGYVDGAPVAMAGWRTLGGTVAEVKRVFVHPDHRGHGHAWPMLDRLEGTAVQAGMTRMVLQTGNRQPAAVALYTRAGYTPSEPYGLYADDPLSLFYGASLPKDSRSAAGAADLVG